MITIEDGKVFLRKHMYKGATCPCCNQNVKVYKRKITSAMAASLQFIANTKQVNEWFYVHEALEKFKNRQRFVGDFPKLRHWGLIDKDTELREDGSNRTGWYKLTEKGRKFAFGLIQVPKHAIIYNQKVLKLDNSNNIYIRDCFKENFDYRELMEA